MTIFLALVAIASACVAAFLAGYMHGKRTMINLLLQHLFGGLLPDQAILYEKDILDGNRPDYRRYPGYVEPE